MRPEITNEQIDSENELLKKHKHKKIISAFSMIAFIAFFVVVFIYIGKPMLSFVSEPERFRTWVETKGFLGKLYFIGMVVLQVIIAIIPGEPLEIVAGYAFGIIEGTILCLIGQVIGSIIVFLFVKFVGIRAVEVFFSREQINSLKFLHNHKKLDLIVFILLFIPGTPKDIITYFVGLTPMKLYTLVLIVFFARIPSVITSTIGGDAIGDKNYSFAIIVFVITIIISGIGILIYRKITKKEKNDTIGKQN